MYPIRTPKMVVMDPTKLSYFAQAKLIRGGMSPGATLTGLGDPRLGASLGGLGFSLTNDGGANPYFTAADGSGEMSTAAGGDPNPAVPPTYAPLPSFDQQMSANSQTVAAATNVNAIDAGFYSNANIEAAQQAAMVDSSQSPMPAALTSVQNFLNSLSRAVMGGTAAAAQGQMVRPRPTSPLMYLVYGAGALGAGYLLYRLFKRRR